MAFIDFYECMYVVLLNIFMFHGILTKKILLAKLIINVKMYDFFFKWRVTPLERRSPQEALPPPLPNSLVW